MPDKLLKIAAWVAAVFAAIITALGLCDRLGVEGAVGWVFDLAAHWPKHLFLLAFAAALFAAVLKAWRPAGLASAVAALNAALVIGTGGFALPAKPPEHATLVKVVSANIHRSWPALNAIIAMARDYGADLISVYEAPDDLAEAQLTALLPDMPVVSMPSQPPEERQLVKRSFLAARTGGADQVDVTTFAYTNSVIIRFLLPAGATPVQIITTHPPSPGWPNQRFDRNRQLQQLTDGLAVEKAFILMGDFNTTPWGRIYGATPGIRADDPRFEGSFPAALGPLGLPIDHIKFGGGLMLVDYRVGPDIGSDRITGLCLRRSHCPATRERLYGPTIVPRDHRADPKPGKETLMHHAHCANARLQSQASGSHGHAEMAGAGRQPC